MKLTDTLPAGVTVDGRFYRLDFEFRNVLRMMEILERDDMLPDARDYVALKCLTKRPRNTGKVLAAAKDILFEKQDFGFFHTCLQTCNVDMAEIHAKHGEKKKAMEKLKKGAEHAEATLHHDKDTKHQSLFFRGSGYGEFGTANGNNMTAELLIKMDQECFDCLRESEEFINLTTRLQETAGKIG